MGIGRCRFKAAASERFLIGGLTLQVVGQWPHLHRPRGLPLHLVGRVDVRAAQDRVAGQVCGEARSWSRLLAVQGTWLIPMLTYINVHMPPSAEREESGPPSRGGATGNGWSTLQ